ncbi:MAG: nicotinamide-nucleotide amidohydrolase family protein, partial [Chloroflexi bacterium]|nr:nicotinamide-nucleotide amidohydrolase family protein [Chloroflexota bacterium]
MGGDPLVDLAARLQAACLAAGATVALAESCTGGMVAAALTEIAGSSNYVRGAVVSYSNDAKRDLLGVDAAVLAAHGAVSAQVARSMALGARERFGAT